MPGNSFCRQNELKRTAKTLTHLLCILFLSCNCIGQEFDSSQMIRQYNAMDEFMFIKYSTIDSLNRQMSTANDSVKVDCLNELYVGQLQLDHNLALRSLEQAGRVARKIRYVKGEGRYLEYLGNYYMEMKIVPSAESALRSAVKLYKEHNLKNEYYDALGTLSLCLYWEMKFDESIQLTDEIYEYLKNIPEDKRIAYVYRRIGLVLETRGKYDQAFDYFMKDKKISETVSDKKGSRKSYGIFSNLYLGKLYLEAGDKNNAMHYFKVSADKAMNNIMPDVYDEQMGEIHFLLNDLDSARYYYLLRKSCIKRFVKDPAMLSWVMTMCDIPLAKIYLSEQRFDTAIILLKPAVRVFKDLLFCADVYKYLGQACLGANRLNEALAYSQQLMDMANYSRARPMLRDAAEIRWKTFESLKQADSALFYLKMFKNSADTLSADKQLRNMEAVEWKAAGDRQEAEISLLGKEKLIHIKQRQILIILLASFSMLAFFVFTYVHLKRKREKAEFEKRATELRMQALRAQMNPHFIFNALNSINNFIVTNDSKEASRYLTKFSRLIRLMLHHSQSSLITLQDELDALKIYIEIEQLRFTDSFDYSIYVPFEIEPATYRVPPLIIQPFVENAIWHGLLRKNSKGTLKIDFFVEEKNVFCRITDNGVGRKNAPEEQVNGITHKSLGMKITTERIYKPEKNRADVPVKILDLLLSDGSSGGTVVTVKLPEEYD